MSIRGTHGTVRSWAPVAGARRVRGACGAAGVAPAGGAALSGCVLFAGCSLLSAGCTLLADEFEPPLVWGGDAGPLAALVVDAGRPLPAPPSEACAREAEASCTAVIGLLEPSVADAGAPAPAAPASLTLPPCPGGFGAFGEPERLEGIEFADDVYGPAPSSDGRTLYFSAYVEGEQQIYAATRENRGAAFSNVTELSIINSTAMDGSPFVSVDGRRLYFFSERPPGGAARRDIWVSERDGDTFGEPALVPGINSPSTDLLPWLTADERTMLFISNRAGGGSGADVWRATRGGPGEAFDPPSRVAELSSPANEGRAVLSADGGTAFFTSDRAGGAPDIWTATRQGSSGPFSGLRRVDVLNSGATELDVMLSSDDRELFFASTRGGASALYRAERGCD